MSSERPKLKPQHAPKAPHEDAKFLESTPARPLRILAEYINPLAQLKREGIGDTIVMFGSARLDSHEVASARLTRLKERKISKLNVAEKAKHRDRKSTRLNSSHTVISYAVFSPHLALHPFPTRRSSDLRGRCAFWRSTSIRWRN